MGKAVSKSNKKSHKAASKQNVLLLGLSRSGKSTLVARLLSEKISEYNPTEGFNLVNYSREDDTGSCLNLWDLGGSKLDRIGWQFFYPVTDGIMYIIDSEDRYHLEENKRQLNLILNNNILQKVPLVIVANKQDIEGAIDETEIKSLLELNNASNMLCGIFGTSQSIESSIASCLHTLVNEMETKHIR
ncbi:GTP-binding ADP-ribosylation factor-like protein ARL2 [Oopsacas minuta]|uniref:GTP-binding ADP-ribosylation factor-like protein ARL2 n=1 Tax=Oopsacas minuta TaxID=111878 RepID=A0AAV7KKG5_9METZ|nr:GTP-binding ADP-ribosylation factor-like protein ARL2 [Oopsacas minuta]